MRAIAQLLMTLGSLLHLQVLVKMGQGLSKTALVGDRVKNVKKETAKSKKNQESDS